MKSVKEIEKQTEIRLLKIKVDNLLQSGFDRCYQGCDLNDSDVDELHRSQDRIMELGGSII